MLFRLECLKALKRRAFWVTLSVYAVFTTIPTLERVLNARENPSMPFSLPESWPEILSLAGIPGWPFLGVLMILLSAPEFSWRTGRQNVIDGLSKERFYAGKYLLLGALVPVFVMIAIVVGVAGTLFSPSAGGTGIIGATDLRYLGGTSLGLLLVGSLALMLAVLIRSSGAALGVFVLHAPVEALLTGLMTLAGGILEDVTRYLPQGALNGLLDAQRYDPAEGVGALATAALIYIAIFHALAFVSIRRRDM